MKLLSLMLQNIRKSLTRRHKKGAECRKALRDKDTEDLANLAYRMIKKALGEICVVYESGGKQVDVTFDVDIPNLFYSYLSEYVEIEIKPFLETK